MALRTLGAPRDLVSRILETPDLARVVQGLEPAVLQQLVVRCGLEDCGPIVALATTEQLMRVFDGDLWRAERAGGEERLDPERFALWLEVLAEAGADVAARRLLEMDFEFVTAAISRQVLVLDGGEMTIDRLFAEVSEDRELAERALERLEAALEEMPSLEVGGFVVVARLGEGWDALAAILVALHGSHHAFFGQLLARCRAFSAEYIDDNGGLYDVLTTAEQVLDDVAGERDDRREREGFVAPPVAAAFLRIAREPVVTSGAPPRPDHVTLRYFRNLEARAAEPPPRATPPDARAHEPAPDSTEHRVHELLTTLEDEGVVARSRAALPAPPPDGRDRYPRIRSFLDRVRPDADRARRDEELGYLANVLVAGCSFQSRRFRPVEAADAVLAACNLGLECWPREWAQPADVVALFRLGWSEVYEEVGLRAARRLVEVVSHLECDDRRIQSQLGGLARRMTAQIEAGTPWRAREDLDVLVILDPPCWSTLLGLVDECPVVYETAGDPERPARRMPPTFEFVSERAQIARVGEFLERLPELLAAPGRPADRTKVR
jgi:uncharacterized protein DUF6178